MSYLRVDKITGRAVIIAEERKLRPNDINEHNDVKKKQKNIYNCPFCPGNEKQTPQEIMSIGNPWNIRVVPNKYPFINDNLKDIEGDKFHSSKNIVGNHYVIIDSHKHFNYLHNMNKDELNNLIKCYKYVVASLYEDERIKYVQVFKNYKKEGGASLEHTHSQAVSLDFYPDSIKRKLKNEQDYYDENKRCIYCDILKEELRERKRVVYENNHFVIITPYASLYPYEAAIYSKKHSSCIQFMDDDQTSALCEAVSFITKKYYNKLEDPAYNLYINNYKEENEYTHWSISIIPRITNQAGFEASTGVMINIVSPEEAKRVLSD